MNFALGLPFLISAAAIVLTLAACQPIPPATVAVEADPPVPGVQMGSAESLLGQDTSHIRLDELERIIQRWEETRQLDPDFDRVIALAPDHANAYFGRGSAYASLGEFDQAIQDFDKTIELDPDHADAYFKRGVAYADLGEFDQAIHDLEVGLEIDPDSRYAAQARTVLAELHAQQE